MFNLDNDQIRRLGAWGAGMLSQSGWQPGKAPTMGQALGAGLMYRNQNENDYLNQSLKQRQMQVAEEQFARESAMADQQRQLGLQMGNMFASGASPYDPAMYQTVSQYDPKMAIQLALSDPRNQPMGVSSPGIFQGMKEGEYEQYILDRVQQAQAGGAPLSPEEARAYQRLYSERTAPKTYIDDFGKAQTIKNEWLPGFPTPDNLLKKADEIPSDGRKISLGLLSTPDDVRQAQKEYTANYGVNTEGDIELYKGQGLLDDGSRTTPELEKQGLLGQVSTRKASNDEVGRFSLNSLALQEIQNIKDMLYEDGVPKKDVIRGIAALNMTDNYADEGGGLVGAAMGLLGTGTKAATAAIDPDINKAYLSLQQSAEGLIRTATGQAMTDEETARYAKRFLPDSSDMVDSSIFDYRMGLMEEFAQLASEVQAGGLPVLSKEQLSQWIDQRMAERRSRSAKPPIQENTPGGLFMDQESPIGPVNSPKVRRYNPATGRLE